MKRIIILLAFLMGSATTANATGIYTCEVVAQDKLLTKAQLTEKLTTQGWKVNRMKPDGGCWEVYGTTPEGLRVEGYFHPASGKQLLLNQRGKVIFRAD
jgi:hypothetical protein